MERGVVLSPQFTRLPTGDVLFKSAVDDFELRKYLTYWDKIDVPKSSFIEFDCHQFRLLEASGHLSRTIYGEKRYPVGAKISHSHQIYLGGIFSAEIDDCTNLTINKVCGEQILKAHEDVYMLRSGKEPGQWSKAQISTDLISFDAKDKEAIEIELYNMLPVPCVETPLEDILEFKVKRHDELVAFRGYLDEMYQQILGAADIPRARNTQLNRLEQAIRDVDKTMKESKIKVFADSLRSVLSGLDGIVGTGLAVGTTVAASAIGTTPLIAGLSGAAVIAGIKMIPQSKSTANNDLTYLKSLRSNFR
ncbi:DUF6236 family protein [Vibrio vulnificus]|uniref:DUF6236 family protein n=1 Tax=Vibrio vulnificus TaxID=672 RepID=UPI00068B0899|nr:DUF6236 family protein [Vibrio vulnificus]MBF4453545.1 hypothetical protein [Vibrio vulnificus]MBF4499398.1 hypothetical protein [Vibrio vulnificus]MBL6178910.1 hypothetical protein [Vibrio vulnificus]NHE86701.1 hypothetical protein [Vibrio vulnificus]POC49137.1 hypothetical protein CRN45_13700 [Vibrio vulnificus]